MFGTSIEYVLRNFTKEYTGRPGKIQDDGSMHAYGKEFHPVLMHDLKGNTGASDENLICTPIYPFHDTHLDEILKNYSFGTNPSCVLVYADSKKSAEFNLLFQYYKIANGTILKRGLSIFCGENQDNIKNWNSSYQHWSEMQPWEIREWFSIFYPEWINEWLDSPTLVGKDWFVISNQSFINDTFNTFKKIINFCNLTVNGDLEDFSEFWRSKQQYIIDEFELLDKIITATVSDQEINWDPICIISEAIIQQRLRVLGYEIRCDGLNTFPTNSKTLYNLLERC